MKKLLVSWLLIILILLGLMFRFCATPKTTIKELSEISIIEMGSQKHPECRENEVFLTNLQKEEYKNIYNRISYKTKRIGIVAYDKYGNTVDGLVPIFVSNQEWDKNEEKIKKMMRR